MEKIDNIVKWFINETSPEPLKLQKLLYFAQGTSYSFYDEPLFEENIEAWVHGPVVSSVYFQYKNYEYNPIKTKYSLAKVSEKALKVLEYVKETFARYDSKYLEEITHNQMPWQYAREGLDPNERNDKIIPKEIIAEYFINQMFQPTSEEWDK